MSVKKFYLIYKITNNINGKFYIGKHETNNLDDDYFGSGKILNYAKEKYGLENFTKTILFYCQNQEEMNLLEHCVVTSEFCQREDVYNIMEGGNGGWNYVNLSSDYAIGSEKRADTCYKAAKISLQNIRNIYGENATPFSIFLSSLTIEQYDQYLDIMSTRMKEYHKKNPGILAGENNPRYGKKNSEHARKLISTAMKTDANFMRNAHHYVNYKTKQNIILHEGDLIPEGFVLGYCLDFEKREQQLKEQKKRLELKEKKNLESIAKKLQLEQTKKIKQIQKTENIEKKKKLLFEMQQWYVKYGWNSMIQHFNYKSTQQNFSQQYIKYFGVSISGRTHFKRKK